MGIELVLDELAYLWGIPLSLEKGAIQIIGKDGSEWFLECPDDSGLLTIHTSLGLRPETVKEYQYWLSLNTNRSKLSFSWVGLQKGIVCLGVSLPSEFLDATLLSNLFDNLYELRENLIQH
ncbi:type III secretion system chaperone [Motiliproteus sp. MSK22-1]|uniref:type III secretion system chaperone n=1 Tax=Motiliproteus sp. MSK22-1 TaxID=1897630 RepID=UPI000977969F|nr:type III secretion system chaperone [Motiliproteus sp. MSK22-1]OMH25645.1 hypothetical protein BGP75_24175 [Motiliproteus sp. MSK22-1]